MEAPLRVMVVDDSVVYRMAVSDALAGCAEAKVVATAANGKIALEQVSRLTPDVLVLDLHMPEMNGIEVLHELRRRRLDVGAIMLSAFTARGADATVAALEAGAFDFVPKPSGGSLQENRQTLRRELQSKLAAYARRRAAGPIVRRGAAGAAPSPAERPGTPPRPAASRPASRQLPQVVALGISTGGPQALAEMLPQVPGDLAAPLLIVQHMPPMFTRSLAEGLNRRCALEVQEACDGRPIAPGQAWIAPGAKQMKVVRQGGRVFLRITNDPPENSCRPSVDYLFRSVAEVYGGRAVGVIMTGMGSDGTAGCHRLKDAGATIVAQDEASCAVYGMPREPIEKGLADVVAPLGRIAAEIVRLAGRTGVGP